MVESSRKPPPFGPYGPPEPRKPLSETQAAIAKLLAHGKSVRQIAVTLDLGETTVDYHIDQIAKVLDLPAGDPDVVDDISTRVRVVAWAFWTYRKGAA